MSDKKRTHKAKIEAMHKAKKFTTEQIADAKNARTKSRNAARKAFRMDYPEFKNSQLKIWPLEQLLR